MAKQQRVLSMREYVEFFLKEYKILSTFDLAMLIHKHSDSKFLLTKKPRSTQLYISTILTKLKHEGKVIKVVKDKKWKWVEEQSNQTNFPDDVLIKGNIPEGLSLIPAED